MKKVFLAGEGVNELGGWYPEAAYRTQELGVIEALARQVAPHGWEVVDAIRWRDIRKLRVGAKGRGAERKNLLGAHLRAREAGADVLVYTRDRDGVRDTQAQIEAAATGITSSPVTAGAVAVEVLEAWLLALTGRSGTERVRPPAAVAELVALAVPAKDTEAMVGHVRTHGIDKVAPDARSLRAFLDSVRAALT